MVPRLGLKPRNSLWRADTPFMALTIQRQISTSTFKMSVTFLSKNHKQFLHLISDVPFQMSIGGGIIALYFDLQALETDTTPYNVTSLIEWCLFGDDVIRELSPI